MRPLACMDILENKEIPLPLTVIPNSDRPLQKGFRNRCYVTVYVFTVHSTTNIFHTSCRPIEMLLQIQKFRHLYYINLPCVRFTINMKCLQSFFSESG